MKMLLTCSLLLSSLSTFAVSIEEIRAVIEEEIVRVEEERGVVCFDTEKLIAGRGGFEKHFETIQYACREPSRDSLVFYMNITMKDSKARPFSKAGALADYKMSTVIIPSKRKH